MARIGHGSKFSVTRDSEVYYLGGITDIQVGGITLGVVDSTDMDSPEAWREFIPGLLDGGDLTVTVHSDPVGQIPVTNVTTVGDRITVEDGSLDLDGLVVFFVSTGTLPGGISTGEIYTLFSFSGSTYVVYDSAGVNVIDITSAGSGDISVIPVSKRWYEAYLLMVSRAVEFVGVEFPSGSEILAEAMISNISAAIPLEDKITTTITAKITGEITWA